MSVRQGPWTAADVPDQSGRIAVVTGANSGIGFEAAAVLARRGAHTVLACRDAGKAEAALARLSAAVPEASVSGGAAGPGLAGRPSAPPPTRSSPPMTGLTCSSTTPG